MNNNIETKINMIYDFNYSKSFNNNMKSFNITTDNISLDDIKIKYSTSQEHTDTVTELFEGKFKLITFNPALNLCVLKRYSDGLSVSIFIKPYNSIEDTMNISSMNNNDCLYSYMLSVLVLNKKLRHILLPIINIDVDFQQIIDIIKPYDTVNSHYMDMMEKNSISNIFSLRVRENFFKSTTLREHLDTMPYNIKKILFQIIFTLAVLQKEHDGFRHNMLNPDSIYVYLKKESTDSDRYEFGDMNFYIKDNSIDTKITNFFIASTKDKKNDYYDLHYFLNSLINLIELPSDKSDELNVFLDRVIPKKYRSKKDNMLDNVELFKPSNLLSDEYFKEFTIKQETKPSDDSNYMKNRKTKSSKEELTRKLKSTKKNKKFLSLDSSDEMKGGGNSFFKPSGKTVQNSPYVSNENRRIRNIEHPPEDKDKAKDKKEEKKEPVVIASQEIVMNPSYQKPFKPMEKPSWDRQHVKFDDKKEILSKPDYKAPYEKKDYTPPYETKPEFKKPYNNDKKPYSEYKKPYNNDMKPYSDYKKPYNNDSDRKPYDSDKKPYDSDKKPYDGEKRYIKKEDEGENKYYKQQKLPNATEAPLLAEQKIYQTAFTGGPAKSTDHTHPKYSNPSFISLDNNIMYPPSFIANSAGYFPYMEPLKKMNEIPLQNVYNINLGNPSVHNNFLSRIYEDALPGDPFNFTMKSTFERNHLISFMRNSMIKLNDGEEMTMQVGPNSFLEYIRMLNFNPFGLGPNPYTSIAPNFLIYGGSYPVRYNVETRQVEIAKYAMAVCIRMYMMTQGAINYRNLGPNITEDNFDVWREIKYYNWVKTELINRKVCPNFITMILYKFDKQSNINWNDLYRIIGNTVGGLGAITRNQQLSQQINLALQPAYINNLVRMGVNLNQVGLHIDSNTCLVALTESPTYNLIEWASPIYQTNGVVRTMTSSGYHSPEVWKSILFQLAYAMAILQEKEIYFRNFDVRYNVFIKDLFVNSQNIGYWIYKINGVEYYVPNYGYMVVIDSSNIQVDKPISIPVQLMPNLPPIPPATPFITVIPPPAGLTSPPAAVAAALAAIALANQAIAILNTAPVQNAIPPAIGTVPHYNKPVFLYKILGSIYDDNGYDDPTYQIIPPPPPPIGVPQLNVTNALTAAQNLAQANNLAALAAAAGVVPFNAAAVLQANAALAKVLNPVPYPPIPRFSWFKYLVREDFIRTIDRANFTNNFGLDTNMQPPDETILTLIDRMHAIPTANISDSLIQFFPEFLHNKIGTLLMKTERDMINPNIMPNFNQGKLIVFQERYDEYKWAIYLGPSINPQQKRIYFKDNLNQYGERTVFNHSLCHFPDIDSVEQIGNRNYKLTKDALIETYTFQ
jgi:hypothetical protein